MLTIFSFNPFKHQNCLKKFLFQSFASLCFTPWCLGLSAKNLINYKKKFRISEYGVVFPSLCRVEPRDHVHLGDGSGVSQGLICTESSPVTSCTVSLFDLLKKKSLRAGQQDPACVWRSWCGSVGLIAAESGLVHFSAGPSLLRALWDEIGHSMLNA